MRIYSRLPCYSHKLNAGQEAGLPTVKFGQDCAMHGKELTQCFSPSRRIEYEVRGN